MLARVYPSEMEERQQAGKELHPMPVVSQAAVGPGDGRSSRHDSSSCAANTRALHEGRDLASPKLEAQHWKPKRGERGSERS
jgi:hypothetical protein